MFFVGVKKGGEFECRWGWIFEFGRVVWGIWECFGWEEVVVIGL